MTPKTQPAIAAPQVVVTPSRYVTIDLAVHITGFSRRAIEGKIARGVWLLGRQYKKADGGILIDIKEYEKWAEKATA
ncbi:excisionase [Diaphorobacter sp. HDW4B]|uniref:excisionase n=1 Tax=Diaphorobacter sp. HDW4B TaxID=2714925 RepID=UPI001408848A|nr:excisionase [Diaphorobacter sp. HDW4B]QIL69546.1 excisionase [Diaphorobacter sp. HDW4B]